MGTSTTPGSLTAPVTWTRIVPGSSAAPSLRKAPAPWVTIQGTEARVATLLTTVGSSHSPLTTGYGGRWSGIARLPSMARSRTVSSPTTKAPCSSRSSMCSSMPLPSALTPSSPASSASRSAGRQASDGDGRVGPHRHVGTRGADGIGGQGDALQDPVRIASP